LFFALRLAGEGFPVGLDNRHRAVFGCLFGCGHLIAVEGHLVRFAILLLFDVAFGGDLQDFLHGNSGDLQIEGLSCRFNTDGGVDAVAHGLTGFGTIQQLHLLLRVCAEQQHEQKSSK
jgi:hypothetical protein